MIRAICVPCGEVLARTDGALLQDVALKVPTLCPGCKRVKATRQPGERLTVSLIEVGIEREESLKRFPRPKRGMTLDEMRRAIEAIGGECQAVADEIEEGKPPDGVSVGTRLRAIALFMGDAHEQVMRLMEGPDSRGERKEN